MSLFIEVQHPASGEVVARYEVTDSALRSAHCLPVVVDIGPFAQNCEVGHVWLVEAEGWKDADQRIAKAKRLH